jgi:hypothetical protein
MFCVMPALLCVTVAFICVTPLALNRSFRAWAARGGTVAGKQRRCSGDRTVSKAQTEKKADLQWCLEEPGSEASRGERLGSLIVDHR